MADKDTEGFTPEEMRRMFEEIRRSRTPSVKPQPDELPRSRTGRRRGLSDTESLNELRRYTRRSRPSSSQSTDVQGSGSFPLDEALVKRLSQKIGPLLDSLLGLDYSSVDLSMLEPRHQMKDTFMELILVSSRVILRVLVDHVAQGRLSSDLQVSQEAVKASLAPIFKFCFRTSGETQSMDEVVEMVSSEMTSRVNSAMSRTSFEGDKPVVNESVPLYTTPNHRLNKIASTARKLFNCCRKPRDQTLSPEEETSNVLSTSQDTLSSRVRSTSLKEMKASPKPVDTDMEERIKRFRVARELRQNGLGVTPTSENQQHCASWAPDSTQSPLQLNVRPGTAPSGRTLDPLLPRETHTSVDKQDEDSAPAKQGTQICGATSLPEPTSASSASVDQEEQEKLAQSCAPCVRRKRRRKQKVAELNLGKLLFCHPCSVPLEDEQEEDFSILDSRAQVSATSLQEQQRDM
ncbi:hypothetical protein NL108_017890 [Boleophthalmus pectinirostris]|nr:hypothetical protein NL108_017890 [Boleophthalmus pectinirostris]